MGGVRDNGADETGSQARPSASTGNAERILALVVAHDCSEIMA